MQRLQIKQIDPAGKTVLLLADFILPIEQILPSVNFLVSKNAKLIVAGFTKDASLAVAAENLAGILNRKFVVLEKDAKNLPQYAIPHVYFLKTDLAGAGLKNLIAQMRDGDIAVLEKLDSYGKDVALELAKFARVFVNDNFGYESDFTKALSELLPPVMGLAAEKNFRDLELFSRKIKNPLVVVLGGMKLTGREKALDALLKRADRVLVGGGVGNLFLKLAGFPVGKSMYDDKADQKIVKSWLRDYRDKLVMPTDLVVSSSLSGTAEVVEASKVKPHHMILDIGPATILNFSREIKKASSLVWRESLGYLENKTFSHGTLSLFRLFASRAHGVNAIAGGDKALDVNSKLGLGGGFDHIVRGSSAMLNYLAAHI